MAFTEVTNQGWGNRVGGSVQGALFGVLLFVVAFPLLFWNEGRAVKTAKSLKEGKGLVISIQPDAVSPANEGKLVHFSGRIDSSTPLVDEDLYINAKALKLVRKVEMYQWKELKESRTKEKIGGGSETITTYTYEKTWSNSLISSSSFKEPGHDNPGQMRYPAKNIVAQDAKLAAFTIPPRLVEEMSGAVDLPLDGARQIPPISPSEPVPAVVDNRIYYGKDPANPQVGDQRISFSVLYPTEVSVIGRQSASGLTPYPTKAGDELLMLAMGIKDAATMFTAAEQTNALITWLVRFGGFFLMFIGLSLLFQPLVMVAKIIPLLGSLLNVGTMLFAGVVAFGFSLVTIGIAWIFYRPVLGVGLLLVAILAIVAIYKMPGRVRINEQGGASNPEPSAG